MKRKKSLNGLYQKRSWPNKLAYIVILICIIQLLTIKALNMMWYPPENINIERGDVLLYTNCQL